METHHQTLQLLQLVNGADNDARKNAENAMNEMRKNPEQSSALFLGYLQVITSQEQLTYRLLACLLLKKLFLDDRAEEKDCV
jgi:hypothetical protein